MTFPYEMTTSNSNSELLLDRRHLKHWYFWKFKILSDTVPEESNPFVEEAFFSIFHLTFHAHNFYPADTFNTNTGSGISVNRRIDKVRVLSLILANISMAESDDIWYRRSNWIIIIL